MSDRLTREKLIARDEVVAAPAERACSDQSFELPTGIYFAMVSMFAGFVAVLGSAFRGGHMGVVIGVIFAFIAAFFAVPTLFPRMVPEDSRRKALSWDEFQARGIRTATGRATALDATILVLVLPFLILCFGIAVATIAAVI